jgi:anthranilate phosphoribosyltransferase
MNLTPRVSERELTREEISAAIPDLLDPGVGEAPKADFLRGWAQRGETAAEMAACAETLLPLALSPGVRGSWRGQPLLDCCGTGGGGLNLINISTGLVFILAAMGIPVVKHGNRGITKKSGSADVLEALGIKIDTKPEHMEACLDKVGAAFLFAPAYHTSFAVIAPVRQKLAAEGRRTIFNLLGPLLNPARPDARLIGVFQPEHVELYRLALERMRCPRFTVSYGEDAPSGTKLGEISARGLTRFGSTLRQADGTPLSFLEFSTSMAEDLKTLLVRDASESAGRLLAILSLDDKGLGRATLLVNAAVAAWTHGMSSSFDQGYEKAKEALDSGRALQRLRAWQEFSAGF